MRWTGGLGAIVAALAIAGCSDRTDTGGGVTQPSEARGDRAARTTDVDRGSAPETVDRRGERTEDAPDRGGERRPEAAEKAREAGRELAGTVSRITGDTIELGDRELRIAEDTEFYRDGVRIERAQVQPGDEVRAAFDELGDELTATRVEVQRRP